MATYADKYVQALVAQNDAKNAQRRADIQAQYDAWEKQQRAAQRAAQQTIPVLQEQTVKPVTNTSYSGSAPFASEEAAQKAQTARKIENDLGNLYAYSRVVSAQKAAQRQAEEQRKAQEEADRQQRLQAQRQAKKQAEKQKQAQVVMDENGMADVDSMKRNARATAQQRQADYAQKQIDKENYPKAQYTEDGKLDVKALQKDARVQQMQNTQTIQDTPSTNELISYYTDKWLDPSYKMTAEDKQMLESLTNAYKREHRNDKDLFTLIGNEFSAKAQNNPQKYPEVQKLLKAKQKTSLVNSFLQGINNTFDNQVETAIEVGKALDNHKNDEMWDAYANQRKVDAANASNTIPGLAASGAGSFASIAVQYKATGDFLSWLANRFKALRWLNPKNLRDVYNETNSLGQVAKAYLENTAKQYIPDFINDTAPETINNIVQGESKEKILEDLAGNVIRNNVFNAGMAIPELVGTTARAAKTIKSLNTDRELYNLANTADAIRRANEINALNKADNIAKEASDTVEEAATKQAVEEVAKMADGFPTRQTIEEAPKQIDELAKVGDDVPVRQTVDTVQNGVKEEIRDNKISIFDENPVTHDKTPIGNAVSRRIEDTLFDRPKAFDDVLNADATLKEVFEEASERWIKEFELANNGSKNALRAATNDLAELMEQIEKTSGSSVNARKNLDEIYELLMHNEMPKKFSGSVLGQKNPILDALDEQSYSNVVFPLDNVKNNIENALAKNNSAIKNSETLQTKVQEVKDAYDKWYDAVFSGTDDATRAGMDVRNAVNRLNTAFKNEGLEQIQRSAKVDMQYSQPGRILAEHAGQESVDLSELLGEGPGAKPSDFLIDEVSNAGKAGIEDTVSNSARSVAESIEPEAKMTVNIDNAKPPKTETPDWTKNIGENQGISRVITNRSEEVITKEMLENDPILQDLAKYEKQHEIDTLAKAMDTASTRGQEWLSDVLAGRKTIDNAVDVDTGIIMARRLLQEAKQAQGTERFKELMDQYYGVLAKVREGGTTLGEGVQAFAKWNNTAEGAYLTTDKVGSDLTKEWVSRNQKAHNENKRIAKALENMGNKWRNTNEPKVLTHEEVKESVKNVLEKEMAGIEGRLDDNVLEYLTILAENKDIPIWKITDEIEHFFKTGSFYTLDESLPVVAEKSKRLSNMLDEIMNGPKKKEQKPEEIGTLLRKIRNTLDDDSSGVSGQFNDDDVYFIEKMFEQKIPKDQFEDELLHKLETGEWKPLDSYQTNKKLQKALDSLVEGEVRKTKEVKPEPSLDQLKKEIKNTFDKEPAGTFKDITDDDVTYVANLMKNGATQEEIAKALDNKLARGNFGISAETQKRVNELFEYAEQFDVNSKEFVESQVEAFKLLANDLLPKASPLEKFNAWRYIAMLGNPKTMLRNAVGNATFNLVTGVSNNLAALGEISVDYPLRALRKGKGIQRTKTFLNPIKDAGLISSSGIDMDKTMYRFAKGSKYKEMNKDILRESKDVFDSKAMNAISNLVDKGISDYPFVKAKYATSLAGYLKANGYDKSIFEADAELKRLKKLSQNQVLTKEETAKMAKLAEETQGLEKARQYALRQAEYATFHEDNAAAKLISEFSRKAMDSDNAVVKGLGFMLEGILPFKKTPANILKSGYEFSPLGIISSIKKTNKLRWENTGARKGNLTDVYKKNGKDVEKTLAADVIESLSKNVTGTGMLLLGYYLYNKGILKSSENKTKYQDQLEGIQNYSIEINGKTYTIDWAAPAVMPLLMGAEVAKLWPSTGKDTKEWYEHFNDYANAAGRFANPLIETSFLSGLRDLVTDTANAVKNEDGLDALASMAITSGTSYATQAIPTLFGQVARTVDNTRRSTYSDKTGPIQSVERNLNRVQNKIPFLSKLNEPYIDTYGREQKNSPYENPLGNFAYQILSPAYAQNVNTTNADTMSRDVYENSDNQSVNLLAKYQSKAEIDGKKVSPEDFTEFSKSYGQANYNIREGLANNAWYNSLSNAEKEKILSQVNNISVKVGKSSIDPTFTDDDKAYQAYKSGGVTGLIDYYRDKSARDKHNISDNSAAGAAVSASSNPEKVAADMSTISMELKRRGLMKSTENVPPKEVVEIYNKSGMAGVNDYMMLNTNARGGSYAGYEKLKTAIPVLTAKEYADIYNTYSVLTSGGNYDNNFAKDTELVPYLTSRSWDSDAQINAVAKALNSSLDGTWSTNGNYLYYSTPKGKVDTYRFN